MYVSVPVGLGIRVGGRIGGGRGGNSGSGGGEFLGLLALIAALAAGWLAGAGIWLAILVVLGGVDFLFGAGRGIGWALGSRARGESIQRGGILRWSATRWWCRMGVTRWVWGWTYAGARGLWEYITEPRGPREWLTEMMYWTASVGILATIGAATSVLWTGTNMWSTYEPVYSYSATPTKRTIHSEWVVGEVEWWAWGLTALAVVSLIICLGCALSRGFFTPLEQQQQQQQQQPARAASVAASGRAGSRASASASSAGGGARGARPTLVARSPKTRTTQRGMRRPG